MSQKDWDAFVEMFGLPGCVVIMPGNIPQGKESEYQSAAEKVAEGASGALPAGGDAKFPSSSVRAGAPFKEHLEWQEKDVVLAGTGGKLAMLTASTGLNSSQGEAHEEAFQEVAQAEAKEISELFQEQFDVAELEAEFPGQPVLAYFEIAAEDKVDAGAVTDQVQKLEGAGLETDPEEVSEKVGLKVKRKTPPPALAATAGMTGNPNPEGRNPNQDPSQDPSQDPNQDRNIGRQKNGAPDKGAQNRAMRIVNAARAAAELQRMESDQFFKSLAMDLKPLRDRVERILSIQDPAIFTQALQEFYRELDRLKADVTADPACARALEKIAATEGANAAAAADANRGIRGPRGT